MQIINNEGIYDNGATALERVFTENEINEIKNDMNITSDSPHGINQYDFASTGFLFLDDNGLQFEW